MRLFQWQCPLSILILSQTRTMIESITGSQSMVEILQQSLFETRGNLASKPRRLHQKMGYSTRLLKSWTVLIGLAGRVIERAYLLMISMNVLYGHVKMKMERLVFWET